MDLSWTDAEHTNITVVLDDGEALANVQGPATVTVPVDPGNADFQYILANFAESDIGPPRTSMPRATQEQPHGQRATHSPSPRRRR